MWYNEVKPYGDINKVFKALNDIFHPYANIKKEVADYMWAWINFRFDYDYLERWR